MTAPRRPTHDPRARLRGKRVVEARQPSDEELDEDEVADELAALMESRHVETDDDSEG